METSFIEDSKKLLNGIAGCTGDTARKDSERTAGRRLAPVTLLGFVRQVMSFVEKWDGRKKPTRAELERIQQWWNESHNCCPEAIAIEIRQVFSEWDFMRKAVNGEA